MRDPGQGTLRKDLPRWLPEFFALFQRTKPKRVGRWIVNGTGIDRRAANLAESMNSLGATITGLDVSAWHSFQEVESLCRRQNVCAKCRACELLTIETMTDTHGARFDFSLIGNCAAVAFAFDFHSFLLRTRLAENDYAARRYHVVYRILDFAIRTRDSA